MTEPKRADELVDAIVEAISSDHFTIGEGFIEAMREWDAREVKNVEMV